MIFRWANAKGYRGEKPDDPADDLVLQLLPDTPHTVQNYPSMPFHEIKSFIEAIDRATHIGLPSRLALRSKVLTGTRTADTVGARWDEIELDRVVFTPQDETLPPLTWPCWVIPAERYKTRTEMVIPLSIRTIRAFVEAIPLSHLHPHLIFPAPGGGMLSTESLISLQHQFSTTVPHGLRNSISEWTQGIRVDSDVRKALLGHSISTHNGAYGRSILAGIRIYLIYDWGEYNYGQLPAGYRWHERFFPEDPDTYPDPDAYLCREDMDTLRAHLESDIAGNYLRGIQSAFQSIQAAEGLYLPHKLAILFAALTGTLVSQVIKARVVDIDVDRKIWTIPAEHNSRQSRDAIYIPLSAPALTVYTRAVNDLTRGASGLLFPSRTDRPLRHAVFERHFSTLKLPISLSVLRSAFREWAYDRGYTERLIVESLGLTQSQPLFVDSDAKGQAKRTKQAERDWRTRVRMMKQWSNFLHGKGR